MKYNSQKVNKIVVLSVKVKMLFNQTYRINFPALINSINTSMNVCIHNSSHIRNYLVNEFFDNMQDYDLYLSRANWKYHLTNLHHYGEPYRNDEDVLEECEEIFNKFSCILADAQSFHNFNRFEIEYITLTFLKEFIPVVAEFIDILNRVGFGELGYVE